MTWKKESQSVDIIDQIVDLRLRSERLKIAETAMKTSSLLKTAGFNTAELDNLVKQLRPADRQINEIDLASYKRQGYWRKKYLTVVNAPGSIF